MLSPFLQAHPGGQGSPPGAPSGGSPFGLTADHSCGVDFRYQVDRGPRSRWFQSEGMPVSGSTGDPPPHRNPHILASAPRRALVTFVGVTESHTSAPVAGQEQWVDTDGSTAGRPSSWSARCSASVRNPEMIEIPNSRRVARQWSFDARTPAIPHRTWKSQRS